MPTSLVYGLPNRPGPMPQLMETTMTIAQLVGRFLVARRTQNNLSKNTMEAYRGDLRSFADYFHDRPIRAIGADELRGFLVHLEEQGLSATSLRRKLAVLKVFFRFLEEEGIIADLPTRKLTGRYRIPRRLPRVLSRQEITQLISAAMREAEQYEHANAAGRYRGLRNHVMLELLFSTGIRIGELVNINLRDINLEAQTLLIYGKGRKERLLFLSSPEVIEALRYYLMVRTSMMSESSALFLNRYGNRLDVHSVGRVFSMLCRKANLAREFSPHCLRHTMATMMIENGADVRSVQEILGHSSITTTQIYLTISNTQKREVFNRCNQRNFMALLSTPDRP